MSTLMSRPLEADETRFRWTTRDWAIVLTCAFVSGFVYLGWDFVYNALLKSGLPGINLATVSLINGVWFLGGFVPAALIRKPGALLAGEALSGFWEIGLTYLLRHGHYPINYIGEQYTVIEMNGARMTVLNVVVFVSILEGLAPEMVLGLRRYLRWDLATFLLAGAAGGLIEWMTGIWVTHYYAFSGPHLLWGTLVSSVIGIALVAGGGGWLVGNIFKRSDKRI